MWESQATCTSTEEKWEVGGESGIVGIDAGCEEAYFPSSGAAIAVAGENIEG